MRKILTALAILVSLCACSKKGADAPDDGKQAVAPSANAVEEKGAVETPRNTGDAAIQANTADGRNDNAGVNADAQANTADANGQNADTNSAEADNETIEQKVADLKWRQDRVDRFAFDYEVPEFMQKMPAPDNNDGATYKWNELTFKVWGANDMHDGSPKKAFEEAAGFLGHAPHYKVVKSNYYVISDFDANNHIFYRKCVYKNDLEYCEEVSYPQSYKKAADSIVKKVASFNIAERIDDKVDNNSRDLAVDPIDCTVTHCKKMAGFEDNGLECDTKRIVDAGFAFGSTVYRAGYIDRGGKSCVYSGEVWEKCVLDKESLEKHVRDNKLDCTEEGGDRTECLYEGPCVPDDDDDDDVDDDV